MATSARLRAQKRRWYEDNKAQQKSYILRRRKEIFEWLSEIKAKQGCVRCPEKHPACLDFHHKNPKEKEIGISGARMRGWKQERILKEIAKCEILCANCHRKEHFDSFVAQRDRATTS